MTTYPAPVESVNFDDYKMAVDEDGVYWSDSEGVIWLLKIPGLRWEPKPTNGPSWDTTEISEFSD